jgi:hypothetical protein
MGDFNCICVPDYSKQIKFLQVYLSDYIFYSKMSENEYIPGNRLCLIDVKIESEKNSKMGEIKWKNQKQNLMKQKLVCMIQPSGTVFKCQVLTFPGKINTTSLKI